MVLFGDVPLVRADTLKQLVAACSPNAISLLTVKLADAAGYGRIIRDNAGNVVRIVEHKDANTKERAINEANTGVLVAPAKKLREWLSALKNNNAQSEYYLTDIIVMAVRDGLKVEAV